MFWWRHGAALNVTTGVGPEVKVRAEALGATGLLLGLIRIVTNV